MPTTKKATVATTVAASSFVVVGRAVAGIEPGGQVTAEQIAKAGGRVEHLLESGHIKAGVAGGTE